MMYNVHLDNDFISNEKKYEWNEVQMMLQIAVLKSYVNVAKCFEIVSEWFERSVIKWKYGANNGRLFLWILGMSYSWDALGLRFLYNS